MAKYLNIGSLVRNKGKDGSEYESIVLDNVNLKAFVELLTAHGSKHLKDLEPSEVMKNKKLPRIYVNLYNPNEKAPDFIVKNLAIKIEE